MYMPSTSCLAAQLVPPALVHLTCYHLLGPHFFIFIIILKYSDITQKKHYFFQFASQR